MGFATFRARHDQEMRDRAERDEQAVAPDPSPAFAPDPSPAFAPSAAELEAELRRAVARIEEIQDGLGASWARIDELAAERDAARKACDELASRLADAREQLAATVTQRDEALRLLADAGSRLVEEPVPGEPSAPVVAETPPAPEEPAARTRRR